MLNLRRSFALALSMAASAPTLSLAQTTEPSVNAETLISQGGDRKVISIGHETADDTFNVSVREYTYPDDDPNHVVAIGWNTTTDGQENAAFPSAGLYFERNFNNPGAPDAFEFHLQSYGQDFGRRYMSFYMPRNGDAESSAASISAGKIVFGDAYQNPVMQIDTTSRAVHMAPSAIFSFNGNNAAVMRQLNAAGTAYIPLWFVDDKDNYAGARPIALSTTFGNDVFGSDALISLIGRGATHGSVGIRVEAALSAVDGTYLPLHLTGNARLSDMLVSNAYSGGTNRMSLLSNGGISEVLLGDAVSTAGARIGFDGRNNTFRISFGSAASSTDILSYNGTSGSIGLGSGASASGQRSAALGIRAVASGADSVALGANAQALGYASSATGADSVAGGYQAMANGVFARAAGDYSMAFGRATFAAGDQAIAMGALASAAGKNAIAVGGQAKAGAPGATAIGSQASANHANSTAVGTGATTTAANQVVLGNSQTAVVVAGIDASTDAQEGPVDVVTVDAAGTLGRQRVATMQSVQAVNAQMEYIAAVTDTQFSALSNQVSDLSFKLDDLSRSTSGGIAAAMALGGTIIVPDSKVSVSVNASTYRGEQGYSGVVAARLAEKVYLTGGVAGSTARKSTGGRVGMAVGF